MNCDVVLDPHFYQPASALFKPSVLLPPERCLECGQVLGRPVRTAGVRVCFLCRRTIIRREKFIFTRRGVRHRNCSNSESYCPVEPEIAAEAVAAEAVEVR